MNKALKVKCLPALAQGKIIFDLGSKIENPNTVKKIG
jgi:hypothetical protein